MLQENTWSWFVTLWNKYYIHFTLMTPPEPAKRLWIECTINGAQDDRPYQMYTYMQNSHCAYTLCDECDCIMIIFWIVANAIAIQLSGYGMIWFSCFVELHYDWVQNSKFSIHHHMIRLCLLLSNTLSDTIGELVCVGVCVYVCLCHPWMVGYIHKCPMKNDSLMKC